MGTHEEQHRLDVFVGEVIEGGSEHVIGECVELDVGEERGFVVEVAPWANLFF